jgi:mannose-6-phosphate isomerase-like protein (cupin superfamily)
MSVADVGDIELEHVVWSADSELVTRRTERWIRDRDPECYRIFFVVSGVMIGEQAGNQVMLRSGDMTMFDLSRPCHAIHGTDPGSLQAVMQSSREHRYRFPTPQFDP